MRLSNLFKTEKRNDLRIFLDGTEVFLDKKQFCLVDLSHTGFAIEGKFRPTSKEQIVNVDFVFYRSQREMMVSCRGRLVWYLPNKAGFEFFELSEREKVDIAYFIKSHQYEIAAE